jgi:membrane protease YdiL (CAAX protease family)
LLIALLTQFALLEREHRPAVLPALALVPLLRLLSLAIPLRRFDPLLWQLMIGLPLLLATVLAIRPVGLSARDAGLGLGRVSGWWQLVIALTGLPLGYAAFSITRPELPPSANSLLALMGGVIVLVIFGGFLEELLFRGLVQGAATPLLGPISPLFAGLASAAVYLGTLDPLVILFMGLVGVLFGALVRRTGSIWGVALAHGALVSGTTIVWPLLTG